MHVILFLLLQLLESPVDVHLVEGEQVVGRPFADQLVALLRQEVVLEPY